MDNNDRIQDPAAQEKKTSPLQNIYNSINISVKTLDYIIAVLIVLLAAALIFGIKNRGYLIEFDSQGGTYVESQKKLYGEQIDMIIPERSGYRFEGWSFYQDCSFYFDENSEINDSFKLYACWVEE